MVRKENIEKEKHKLIKFGQNHHHVYIYGAGRYGKIYFDVLQHYGVHVDGFIITGSGITEYCGCPVYNIKDITAFITEQDGIIPAYLGSTPEEIMENFDWVQPDVLGFDHKFISYIKSYMEYEMYFSPIMDELKNKFPVLSLTKDQSWTGWKDLLVIRLDDLIGDLVCTTAFIRELKLNCPESTVTVVIRKQNELLLRNCPYIDKLLLCEGELSHASFLEGCRNYNEIQAEVSEFASRYFSGRHFDVVFLPRGALNENIALQELSLAFYSKAEYRIGHFMDYSNDKTWLYDVVKEYYYCLTHQTQPQHESLAVLDMLKECGLSVGNDRLELWPDNTARISAKKIFKQYSIKGGDKLIAIGLVGSVPAKNWSVDNYNKLISAFYESYGNHYKFVIFGGKDAVEAASKLIDDTEIVVNLAGKLPLDVTVACMECCDLYVGADTGLMHIATAVDKPSVTLYRALDDSSDICGYGPGRWGARREDSIALLPPSGLDGCHIFCRKKYSHCINQITPFQVRQSIEYIMDKKC